ncbi:hypothetical protein G9A89_013262 [Geosiphon pyriformis]|nr:hypothetical protein G9A89_013262 [Geosiphon pyriformis]
MEITNNIHSLAQQIFQLIQHQKMEITINQQTIQYKSTARIPQHKVQRKLENVVDKIMIKIKLAIKEQQIVGLHQELTRETWTWWMQQFPKNYCYFHLEQHVNIQNLYTNKTKWLFDTTILKQLEQFLYMGFQDQPKILFNTAIDTVMSNQLGKMTNTQFEELQTQITQVILEKEKTYGGTDVRKQHWYTLTEDIISGESSTIKLSKQSMKLQFQETIDKLLPLNLCPLYKKLD